jgi:carboxypeptidase Q
MASKKSISTDLVNGETMKKYSLILAVSALFLVSQDSFSQEKKVVDVRRATIEKIVAAALKNNDSYKKLQELCDDIGARLSGSDALNQAIEWALNTFKADGQENVRKEDVMVPKWVRGQESATMLEPRLYKLSMLGLGGSVGTPKSGVTGEVIVVHSRAELEKLGDRVKDKIVLFNVAMPKYDPIKGAGYGATVSYRTSGAHWAAKQGAVAALVRSVTAHSLQSPHTGGMRYRDGVKKIPNAAISVENAELLDRLTKRGKKVVVRLKMEAKNHGLAKSANVLAEIKGHEKPEEIIVIGGHIDSWDVGQGAQDDGGGCVMAMEALNVIRKLKLRPRRTIRVVLFTNEENGLAGARQYAETHKAEMKNHIAAIESDSGSFQPLGFNVDHRNPDRKSAALARVQEILNMVPDLKGKVPLKSRLGYAGADIGPIKFFGATTLGLWVEGSKYFDYHHTHSDTVDKVDPKELSRGTALMAAMVYTLADMPGRLDTIATGSKPEPALDLTKPKVVADALLKAYKAKNFKAFRSYVKASKSSWFESQLKAGTPVFESLFGEKSWRLAAVQSWGGKLGETRIGMNDTKQPQALVQFSRLDDSSIVVVQLHLDVNKSWYFTDLRKMPKADFEKWGASLK